MEKVPRSVQLALSLEPKTWTEVAGCQAWLRATEETERAEPQS